MKWFILLHFWIGPSVLVAKTVFWQSNTNWENGENWQLGHVACANEKLAFPENTLVYLSSRVSFRELQFSANSLLVLDELSTMHVGRRVSEVQCKSASNKFTSSFKRWFEPSSWCASVSPIEEGSSVLPCDESSELSLRVAPLLHLPCTNDHVVFAANSTQQIELDLRGESLYEAVVNVASLTIDGGTMNTSDSLRTFLRSEIGKRTFRVTLNGQPSAVSVDDVVQFTSFQRKPGASNSDVETDCGLNLERADQLCEPAKCTPCNDEAEEYSFLPIGACCKVCERGLYAVLLQLDRPHWTASQSLTTFFAALDTALEHSPILRTFTLALQPVNSSFVQLIVHTVDGTFPEDVRSVMNELLKDFAFQYFLLPSSAFGADKLLAASTSTSVAIGSCLAVLAGILIVVVAVGYTLRRRANREECMVCLDVNCLVPMRALRQRVHQASLRRRASAEFRAAQFMASRLGEPAQEMQTDTKESTGATTNLTVTSNGNEPRHAALVLQQIGRPFARIVDLVHSVFSYSRFRDEPDESRTAEPAPRVPVTNWSTAGPQSDAPLSFANPTYEEAAFTSVGSTSSAFTFDVAPQVTTASDSASGFRPSWPLSPSSPQYQRFVDDDSEVHSDLQQAIHAFAGHTLPSPTGSTSPPVPVDSGSNVFKRSVSSASSASHSVIMRLPSISEFVELEMSSTPLPSESNA